MPFAWNEENRRRTYKEIETYEIGVTISSLT